MRIGTLAEALQSLKERYRKSIIENRTMMILLWLQLALMLAFVCSYLVIEISIAYAIVEIRTHLYQPVPVSIVCLVNLWRIGFWSFVLGLPLFALILGIGGILPGTRRKSRCD